jgi:hypothetical protein
MTTNETPMTEEQKFICEECEKPFYEILIHSKENTYCNCKEEEEFYFMIKIYDKDGKFDCYWEEDEKYNYWLDNEEEIANEQFEEAIKFYQNEKNDEGEYDRWVIELVKIKGAFPSIEEEIVIDDFVVNGDN